MYGGRAVREDTLSLDIDIYEAPLVVFYHKQATENTGEYNPDSVYVDITE